MASSNQNVPPGVTGLEGTDFPSIARNALRFLHSRLGFGLWMVTRTEGDNWVVLEAEDHGYGVKPPDTFCWADSFCSRMVLGQGPRVAPDSRAIPEYASAPIARQVPIGAYIGVPLTLTDGTMFGTLCAIDPHPQPAAIAAELPLVETIAAMVSGLLAAELSENRLTRLAEGARAEAETDNLTQLFNRRGWERLLSLEEGRCARYAEPACIIAVDLDGLKDVNDTAGHSAGDELIRRAADALREAVRATDVVARLGGDEFFVLAPECCAADASALLHRVKQVLSVYGVSASAGMAMRAHTKDFAAAIQEADRRMYLEKGARRAAAAIA